MLADDLDVIVVEVVGFQNLGDDLLSRLLHHAAEVFALQGAAVGVAHEEKTGQANRDRRVTHLYTPEKRNSLRLLSGEPFRVRRGGGRSGRLLRGRLLGQRSLGGWWGRGLRGRRAGGRRGPLIVVQ